MFKHFILLLVIGGCLFSCRKTDVPANSESSAIKIFGGEISLSVADMETTSDGGFIFSGHAGTNPSTGDLAFMLKTDANGNQQWLKTFGGPQTNGFEKVRQTSDGGYIAVGYTGSYGFGPKDGDYYADGWMMKTDGYGNMAWQKFYGDIYADTLYDVKEMPDHGFVTIGRFPVMNSYFQAYVAQFYMMRTDPSGKIKWKHSYFNDIYKTSGRSIDICPNGDIVASGLVIKSSLITDQGTFYPSIIYVNASTGLQKGTNIIFSNFDNCGIAKIVGTPDGYVLAANNIHDSITTINLIKTDLLCNFLWQKQYANGLNLANLSSSSTGGFNISGTQTGVVNKPVLLGVDASGNLISDIVFGNSGLNDQKFSASQPTMIDAFLSGSRYAVCASISNSSISTVNKFVLFFSDQNGKISDHGK